MHITIKEAVELVAPVSGKEDYSEYDLRRLLLRELRWCYGSIKNLVPKQHHKAQGLISDRLNSYSPKGCFITQNGLKFIKNHYRRQQQQRNARQKPSFCRVNGAQR